MNSSVLLFFFYIVIWINCHILYQSVRAEFFRYSSAGSRKARADSVEDAEAPFF